MLLTPIVIRMLEGRVGSTLMMQLLGSSPAIAFDRKYAFQNSYLTYLVNLLQHAIRDSSDEWNIVDMVYGGHEVVRAFPFKPELLDCEDFKRRGLGALWAAFSDSISDQDSGQLRYYAEKYWGSIEPLLEAGLSPVVIDLLRDPRDIVCSVRAFNRARGGQLFGRPLARDEDDHLKRLVYAMAFRFQEMSDPIPVQRITLRYEDVITDLPGTADQLSAMLGVELDAETVLAATPSMAHHVTSPSAAQSIGRWQHELSSNDISVIERRLGRHMKRFGYAVADTD